MKSKVYSIKEVAQSLDIEDYVLRYYEKELDLDIHRNTQRHRIYTDTDIEMLRKIKDLREQGLGMKIIKNILLNEEEPSVENVLQLTSKHTGVQAPEEGENDFDITDLSNDKVSQFSALMKQSLKQALEEYNTETKDQIKEELTEEMTIMVEKRIREIEVIQTQKNEHYYNKIDETMREMQRLRKELAEVEQVKDKESIWKKLFRSSKKTDKHHNMTFGQVAGIEKESM